MKDTVISSLSSLNVTMTTLHCLYHSVSSSYYEMSYLLILIELCLSFVDLELANTSNKHISFLEAFADYILKQFFLQMCVI